MIFSVTSIYIYTKLSIIFNLFCVRYTFNSAGKRTYHSTFSFLKLYATLAILYPKINGRDLKSTYFDPSDGDSHARIKIEPSRLNLILNVQLYIPGGDSPLKMTGVLVGNFEKNP